MNFREIRVAWIVAGVSIGLFLSTSLCNAGVENRPINTDDAYTLGKGSFTLSTGAVYTKDNGDKETDINIDLGYGITDRFEITVDIPVVFSDPKGANSEEGFGDISLRPEFKFLEESEGAPALSLASTVKLKSGDKDKGLGSGETDYSVSLQASKTFDPISVHFNVGFTFIGGTGERRCR